MAPFPSADHRRPSDTAFKVLAGLAAVVLVAFVVFVIVRDPSHGNHGASSAALEAPPPTTFSAGTAAPAFSLPRLNGGAPVNLAEFRGTPVVLNFFASWCQDCRAELAAVAAVARQSSGHVAVVGVDSNDTSAAAAAKLLASVDATYPVGVDANAAVATKYLLSALPVTYYLNADGRVVGASLGPQTVASLDHWIKRLEAPAK